MIRPIPALLLLLAAELVAWRLGGFGLAADLLLEASGVRGCGCPEGQWRPECDPESVECYLLRDGAK